MLGHGLTFSIVELRLNESHEMCNDQFAGLEIHALTPNEFVS